MGVMAGGYGALVSHNIMALGSERIGPGFKSLSYQSWRSESI